MLLRLVQRQIQFGQPRRGELDGLPALQDRLDQLRAQEGEANETAQYKTWLRMLFMLLTPMSNGPGNFLEEAIKSLFEQENTALVVHVHRYDDHRCLLSDRGFSWPIEHEKKMVFDFNLRSDAFIRYVFADYEALLGRPLPERIKHGLRQMGPKPVYLTYFTNDFFQLDLFHRRVIEQAHEHVYCSATDVYSATTLVPSGSSKSGSLWAGNRSAIQPLQST